LHDSRGAVLLIAVFMSAFLVGALWYIIGIGDAAIYRQYMQDGADAVAFGSAVYHARGMNILALINLVMAAVLMVLIAFKIGQILLAIANIASCLAGAFFNPVCDLTTAAEEPYAQLVDRVEQLVDKILRALYQASNAVAIGMPWVAEGKAIHVAKQYKPTVDSGFMLSVSLVPSSVESAVGGLVAEDPKGDSKTPGGPSTPSGETKKSNGKKRWGLPVQDEEYVDFCGRAGEKVGHLVFLPFEPVMGGLAEGIGKFAGGAVKAIVSAFPSYFCGGGSGSSGSSFKGEMKDAGVDGYDGDSAEKKCKKREKEAKKEKAPFDMGDCLKKTKKDLATLDSAGTASSSSNEEKTTKMVYEPATLGDDYFAVWAFASGDLSDQTGAHKGVEIAGWNKAKVSAPTAFSKIALAKSEFYYEPRPDDPRRWKDGLADDAMWNMRWRARLRRLRLPIPAAGAILATKINGAIPKIPIFGDMLSWPGDKLGELVDDEVSAAIAPLTSIIAH